MINENNSNFCVWPSGVNPKVCVNNYSEAYFFLEKTHNSLIEKFNQSSSTNHSSVQGNSYTGWHYFNKTDTTFAGYIVHVTCTDENHKAVIEGNSIVCSEIPSESIFPSITVQEGLEISGAIILLWAIAYKARAVIDVLSNWRRF